MTCTRIDLRLLAEADHNDRPFALELSMPSSIGHDPDAAVIRQVQHRRPAAGRTDRAFPP